MERFAERAGLRTIWSNEVARLEDDRTSAVIVALVLEDDGQPARRVRGVRIMSASARAHDEIYLDEEATARTRSALDDIARTVAFNGVPDRNGCVGAKEFWPLYEWVWNKYHELNAEFCKDSKGTALLLYGRGRPELFRFPGESPSHLAAILSRAIEQLKLH